MKKPILTLCLIVVFVARSYAAIALVAHAGAASSNNSTVTSAGINTSGATCIIVGTSSQNILLGGLPLTDSYNNNWILLGPPYGYGSGNFAYVAVYVAINPTVGPGHTFTLTGSSGNVPALAVQAWSGTSCLAIGPSVGTASQGSNAVLPRVANSLVISILAIAGTGTPYAVNSGFTISDSVTGVNAVSVSIAMAYLIQTTAASVTPVWTSTADQPQQTTFAVGPTSFPVTSGPAGGAFVQ